MLKVSRTLCSCLTRKQRQIFTVNELPKAFLKTSSSLNVKELPSDGNLPQKDWSPLYTLPGIRFIYVFTRIKIHLPVIFLVVAAPAAVLFTQMGETTGDIATGLIAAGIINFVMLSAITYPLSDVVGAVHIKNDKSEVIIASFDFWGRPRKTTVSPYDVKKLEAKNPVDKKCFRRFQLGDDSDLTVKIMRGKALVSDYETFTKIFGSDILKDTKK